MSDEETPEEPSVPWDAVVEDMHTTAESYRNAGWETVELVPDPVRVLAPEDGPGGQGGFDVVVSEEAFDGLVAAIDGETFDSFEVFRAEVGGVVYLVVAVENGEGDLAVFYPAAYGDPVRETVEALVESGTVYTHVRAEDGDDWVTFSHDEPEPFLPDEENEA